MFDLFKRRRRQTNDGDSFAFGERVGDAMLQDIHLQAEILLPLRRMELMRLFDDNVRNIAFVNDQQFAVQTKSKLDEICEIWSDTRTQQRDAMREIIAVRLGSDALDLAPDLLDQVIDIEIDLQWKKLVDEMIQHGEQIMKLRSQWIAAGNK